MKLNIGIVGYGNLGKAAEQVIISKNNCNLIAIFSRRDVKSRFNTPVESYENISLYKGKIDVMLLCGGSFSDIEKQSSDCLINFDCINTFDNHKKLSSELERLDKLAKLSGHRLIMACGWDPGIFSNLRAICYAFSNEKPIVFWGKGISMGHSEAVRRVKCVKDAVAFTIPNIEVLKQARRGTYSETEQLHTRECFVVADKKHHKRIETTIKNIPNYFKGQQTKVNFVSQEKLLSLRTNLSHKGEIISNFKTIMGSKCKLDFRLKLKSNPDFTATVMSAYIEAIRNLKANKISGAFTPLDIPMSFLFKPSARDWLIKELG